MTNKYIKEKIINANKNYRQGHPIMSDFEYDRLVDMLEDNDEYKQKPEPEPLYKNHIKHSKPMLSMQKAKEDIEVHHWIDSVIKAGVKTGTHPGAIFICTNAKLDGIAGCLDGITIATRGNGIEGNDVSDLLEKGVHLDIPEGTFPGCSDRLLGEIVVKKDYFDTNLSEEFSNARNFVSGATMADTLNLSTKKAFKDKAIVFKSYATLDSFIFPIEETKRNFRRYEEEIWAKENWLIDGVILSVVNEDIRKAMGETSHHPNWAIALKPQDKSYFTEIVDIEWATGRTGKVTPTAILEEVDIEGVKVNRATAHNAKNVIDLGLQKGTKVEIVRSGSVIPYIVGVVE